MDRLRTLKSFVLLSSIFAAHATAFAAGNIKIGIDVEFGIFLSTPVQAVQRVASPLCSNPEFLVRSI